MKLRQVTAEKRTECPESLECFSYVTKDELSTLHQFTPDGQSAVLIEKWTENLEHKFGHFFFSLKSPAPPPGLPRAYCPNPHVLFNLLYSRNVQVQTYKYRMVQFGLAWKKPWGCGQKKFQTSVPVPAAPVRVPSQRPLVPSVASVTSVANDKGPSINYVTRIS